jgi:hypothetical protein
LTNRNKAENEWQEINDCVEFIEIQSSDSSISLPHNEESQSDSTESVSKKLNLEFDDSPANVSLKESENRESPEKATCSTKNQATVQQNEMIDDEEENNGEQEENLEVEVSSTSADDSYKSIIFESTIDDEFGDSSFVTSPSQANIKTENEQTDFYVVRNQVVEYASRQETSSDEREKDGDDEKEQEEKEDEEKSEEVNDKAENERDKTDDSTLFDFMGNKLSSYKVNLTDKELNKFIIDYVFDSFEF